MGLNKVKKQTMCRIWVPIKLHKNNVQGMTPQTSKKTMFRIWPPTKTKQTFNMVLSYRSLLMRVLLIGPYYWFEAKMRELMSSEFCDLLICLIVWFLKCVQSLICWIVERVNDEVFKVYCDFMLCVAEFLNYDPAQMAPCHVFKHLTAQEKHICNLWRFQ